MAKIIKNSNCLPSNKIKDIRGERFGRLLVESFGHISTDKGKNVYWNCVCDCGNTNRISSSALRAGSTISCGCYKTESSRRVMKQLHTKGKHLYFIQCGPYIKIGRADQIQKRLGQLRAMNPYEVTLVRYIENAGHLEHHYHEVFKEHHYKGEWFLLDPCEVVSIGAIND